MVHKMLQEYERSMFIEARLEATSTVQYLVLRMCIHTRGWLVRY